MLKSLGIHRRSTWLVAFVSIGATYRPVLAQGTGCAGDIDADGDVDLLDYAEFSNRLSGPGGGSGGVGCACFDLDGDVDIDLSDFTLFSQEFTGPLSDCPSGQTSCDGTCAGENERYLLCGGVCVDTWVDPAHCGGCGISCGGGQTCLGAACQDQEPCHDCGTP